MAALAQNYAHPTYLVRYPVPFAGIEAGGAATTVYGRTPMPFAGKIRNVFAVVTVIATATTHKLDIYNGTTSIGSISLSTLAVGGTATSGDLNSAVSVGQVLSLKTGADAAGKALAVMEWQTTPDALINVP